MAVCSPFHNNYIRLRFQKNQCFLFFLNGSKLLISFVINVAKSESLS